MSAYNSDALYKKLKSLNELLWEGRANRPVLDQWLDNFTGGCASPEIERQHALYLLSKFLYLGRKEIRELLRSMFRDLVRHPLSVEARTRLTDKNDFPGIHQEFVKELNRTRFTALGSPAESGTHILYEFRQENDLPASAFINLPDLVAPPKDRAGSQWKTPRIHRLIIIDDFCGTGRQVKKIAETALRPLRQAAKNTQVDIEIWYLTLLATTTGITSLQNTKLFDRVESLSVLDDTYRVFGTDSQCYVDPPDGITKEDAENIMRYYGKLLSKSSPLGYGNCQLLVGFGHNIPNNTLPVIWQKALWPVWQPIFQRWTKLV